MAVNLENLDRSKPGAVRECCWCCYCLGGLLCLLAEDGMGGTAAQGTAAGDHARWAGGWAGAGAAFVEAKPAGRRAMGAIREA